MARSFFVLLHYLLWHFPNKHVCFLLCNIRAVSDKSCFGLSLPLFSHNKIQKVCPDTARPPYHEEREGKNMLCQNITKTSEPDIFIDEIKEGTLLTREQEQALGKKIKEGDKAAVEIMVTHNLGLVKKIASKYTGRGLDYEDLLQEGYIGLISGINKFDYTLGYKFSTYATWWIQQAIIRALADKSRTIRLPVHINDEINYVRKEMVSLYNDLGRSPSEEEVAQKTGLPQEKVRMLIGFMTGEPVSLDYEYGDEENATLKDYIRDTSKAGPDEEVEQKVLKEYIVRAMGSLTDREKRIIVHRFGLGGTRKKTLDEVGKLECVTRERIRQIERKALAKMRRGANGSMLRDFL